jgi:hypothetical protein
MHSGVNLDHPAAIEQRKLSDKWESSAQPKLLKMTLP